MTGFILAVNICFAILFLPYIVISKPTISKDDTKEFQFGYVGSADGKSFFADISTNVTWAQAKSFCTASGMHLASIKTAAQQTLLKAASNTTAFRGEFWTGGRDAQTHSQFVWDFDKIALTSSGAGIINVYQAIQTCVYYVATTGHMHLHSGLCTEERGALCEIVT